LRKAKTPKVWKVQITFVPFESESDRDDAYRNTVRTFLEGKTWEMEHIKQNERRHEHDKGEIQRNSGGDGGDS
jgi:hypothetical protein